LLSDQSGCHQLGSVGIGNKGRASQADDDTVVQQLVGDRRRSGLVGHHR
jgi:hypothetical protein